MGSPAGRLLELLSLLQAKPRWTGPELAARLRTTQRTVRRDVTRLRDLGYPVEAEPGPQGGYRLGPGRALPPLLLTDDEAVAVAVGLREATSGGGVDGYDEAAVAALAKLEQVLPSALRGRVRALATATTLVRRGPGGPGVDPDALLTLAQGCRGHERVAFAYRDADGNESERRVEPYGLVNVERRWYLLAFDLDRQGWRTFRLDRMVRGTPTRTGHRFAPVPDPPDQVATVLDGMARWADDVQAEVLLDATYDAAIARIPATVGRVEPRGAKAVLHLGSDDLGWTARYLAGLPWAFEVLDPPELRSELRRLADRLARS